MKKKNLVTLCIAAALSLSAIPAVSAGVCANEYYTWVDATAGIEFSSFEKLSEFVSLQKGKKSVEDIVKQTSDFILSADGIYLPAGYDTGSTDKIIITPLYVSASFKVENGCLYFKQYHSSEAAEGRYSHAKDCGKYNEHGTYSGIGQKDGVYYYSFMNETYYVFMQDGYVFELIVPVKDAGESYLKLCKAEKTYFSDAPQKGLSEINGKLYYINADGSYARGWKTVNGSRYYFAKNGAAATKNTVIGGKRYKFSKDGKCLGLYTGFASSKGKKYYYKKGVLQTGTFTVNGKTYNADENGVIETGA